MNKMKHLISLPENTIDAFYSITGKEKADWFCTSDPAGTKVGSGGGTAWLLSEAWKEEGKTDSFADWLSRDRKLLIHGGGQGRRLPAYAPQGKLLLPIPVFRWARGQRLNQTLLDLQLPLFEKLMNRAPEGSNTLLASGDVLLLADKVPATLPQADIICFGLSVDPSLASRHGVFICPRNNPETLEYMLQKPSTGTLKELMTDFHCFVDVGIWILSDRAVDVLMKKCGWNKDGYEKGIPQAYDFYGSYGPALGEKPQVHDKDISGLSTAVVSLSDGEFYHFGSSREIISSSLALQNRVIDQKAIRSRMVKPHPAMFVQNSVLERGLTEDQADLWIENSCIGADWKLGGSQVITGVPENDWKLTLPTGICLDMVPVNTDGQTGFCLRPYGMNDAFRGPLEDSATQWMARPFADWLKERALDFPEAGLDRNSDIQSAPLFPVIRDRNEMEKVFTWMIHGEGEGKDPWLNSPRLSADQISSQADLAVLETQRRGFRAQNWPLLAKNHSRSVFYQVDLDQAAGEFAQMGLELPQELDGKENAMTRCHDRMFRSRVQHYKKVPHEEYKDDAFRILRQGILDPIKEKKVLPCKNVYEDQIIWSRSPVRIDLAGGWTDTPPISVLEGGKVVTVGLELNGQPPLQAYVRPSKERTITLRSIDLGKQEIVTTYEELARYDLVGSPFAIPKAALCLAGFHPDFCSQSYPDLKSQLEEFGAGLEISLLAAIPKGSGMGTSSILASTILGGLSDFCQLGWDHYEIGNRTLGLEQLLTTGGGWQDQYGGVLPGIKLLETQPGWDQTPLVRWLPDHLFTNHEYRSSMLLYYTGITRVAKNLLAEIVEGMFLNERERLDILSEMKNHALDTCEAIQRNDYEAFGYKVGKSWDLNVRLDEDTTSPEINSIITQIDDLAYGYKLPGAGGGGYLYICAKDPQAADMIRKRLNDNPPNPRARFVELGISQTGLEVTRS